MNQAFKALKNFNLKGFTFEDLKNNKSLISSKLEICCEDRSIHLPTKIKKISCSSQVQRRQNQRAFFCKRIEIEIVLIIHQYKFIFANHISFQFLDFPQLRNFVFTNSWHAWWDHHYLSSLLHQLVTSFEALWLQRRLKSTILFLEQVKLILHLIQTLHQVLIRPILDL